MPYHAYMAKLKLDDAELRSRRAYFEITDADLARLAALRPFALKHDQAITDDFYRLILSHEEARRFFPDDATVSRVKEMQKQYFLGLFSGVLDLAYVEDRLRVGVVHERIGMPPKFYVGSYSRYQRLILDYLHRELAQPEALEAFRSIKKLVAFDMALAIDTYVAASLETVSRHQQAIRELSTPIIRLHDRVLLMPLVGTIDTQRAQQVMETLLVRVIEDKAKVVILDIAGVPVVDTRVADHLLQTNSAVRLLGAQTIITGISGTVARTLVQLGVDVSNVQTQSQLTDGIEVALRIVGRRIVEVA